MDGFNDQNNTGYTDPGFAQDGYTQQYTQPQYTQPQYTQTPDMGAYNQVNTSVSIPSYGAVSDCSAVLFRFTE